MSTPPALQVGDTVRVTDGPFVDLTGPVRSIDVERKRVQLVVPIFGDETLIDINLSAVERQ